MISELRVVFQAHHFQANQIFINLFFFYNFSGIFFKVLNHQDFLIFLIFLYLFTFLKYFQ